MKRLDVVFHDAGGGHRNAATALELVIKRQQRSWDVRLVNFQIVMDSLDVFRKVTGIRIQEMYNKILRKGWTLGSTEILRVLQTAIRVYHQASVKLLTDYWAESRPDLLISVIPHFNRALCESFRAAAPGKPFVTVLTDLADFPPHFWIERQEQFLICGSDRAVEQAHALGHDDAHIFRASGMILHPRFYETGPLQPPPQQRIEMGLQPDLPTGLVLFGGYGSEVMLQITDRLSRSSQPLQLILLCGRNDSLATHLREKKWRLPIHVEGFTARVNEFMRAADFFIGKPGPGSISESLEMKLPVIVESNSRTLPQERYNAEWIEEGDLGIVLPNFKEIDKAVEQMLQPENLSRYRSNVRALKNRAVFEIPSIFEQILEERPC
ncbi:MAG TPA: glycosyltransferase [Candidatus Dormibacteraeota bacterium]|nr:glycosyltransferase [Candidatus Dormibacteraeota bacterium]